MSGVKGRSGRKPNSPLLHGNNVVRGAISNDTCTRIFHVLAKNALAGSVPHARLLLSYIFGQPRVKDDPLDGLTPEEAKTLVDFKSRMAKLQLDNMLKLVDQDSTVEFYEPEVLASHDSPPPHGDDDNSHHAAS